MFRAYGGSLPAYCPVNISSGAQRSVGAAGKRRGCSFFSGTAPKERPPAPERRGYAMRTSAAPRSRSRPSQAPLGESPSFPFLFHPSSSSSSSARRTGAGPRSAEQMGHSIISLHVGVRLSSQTCVNSRVCPPASQRAILLSPNRLQLETHLTVPDAEGLTVVFSTSRWLRTEAMNTH